LTVVIPLFNEEENIEELYRQIVEHLDPLGEQFELLLVNDGSRDATPERIEALAAQDPRVRPIHLSRNFGHQPAITAGIDLAEGDAVIVMDGDLQDSPALLPQFVQRWREGYDVVYAVRVNRKEGLAKRIGYALFYRVLRGVSDLEIPLDSGDFGLMDRRVVEVLKQFPERMRFVRGLRAFIGFRQTGVLCERSARNAGRPKYTLAALVRLAIDGIISFSNFPLNLVTYLGLVTGGIAALLTLWVLIDPVGTQLAPRGWASTILAVLLMGTVQLLSLGIIGEYVRRIFVEVKGRPTYIIQAQQHRHRGHRMGPLSVPPEKRPA
jgi:dolichol-phosphate mannosyltransferase